MIKFGIVSYNMYCNFTNYGSALQSYALYTIINRIGKDRFNAILVDYCPKSHLDKDPLNPIKNMWDTDEESILMCNLSMPAIRENYKKFTDFYRNMFTISSKYTYENFDDIVEKDNINAFVCGSDTIFCIEEFNGFDDGYYANFPCMRNGFTISYAASFGDSNFNELNEKELVKRLYNFKSLGIRENRMIPFIKKETDIPCEQTIDPTLLLKKEDYDKLATERIVKEKYILLYARRYDKGMFDYADKIAKRLDCKVVNISLRASYKDKHMMFYNAGVEEFLSLVKHSEYVVTNSFHGLIFAVQFSKKFTVFTREQAGNKIAELLDLFGLQERHIKFCDENFDDLIDYEKVHSRISNARKNSIMFLSEALNNYFL